MDYNNNPLNNYPLISIITAVYNGSLTIGRYLDSILNQTYKNIELVIINDGSIDNTEEVIFEYKERLTKKGYTIHYEKQSNQGLGAATNEALKHVHGDYFLWCNADDYYDKNAVSKCVEATIKNPDIPLIRFDGMIVDENLIPIKKMSYGIEHQKQELLLENAIFDKNFHYGCSMVKTSAFIKNNNNSTDIYPSRYGQNWQILLPVLKDGKSLYIDEVLFYFVTSKNNLSNNINKNFENIIRKNNEFEKILLSTLGNIDLKDKYCDLIKIKYLCENIHVCFKYHKTKYARKLYKELNNYPYALYKDYYLPRKIVVCYYLPNRLYCFLKGIK